MGLDGTDGKSLAISVFAVKRRARLPSMWPASLKLHKAFASSVTVLRTQPCRSLSLRERAGFTGKYVGKFTAYSNSAFVSALTMSSRPADDIGRLLNLGVVDNTALTEVIFDYFGDRDPEEEDQG